MSTTCTPGDSARSPFPPPTLPIEADHGRFKARLRPMRGVERLRSAAVVAAGHAFVQNLRRGHHELAADLEPKRRLPAAFAEIALAIGSKDNDGLTSPSRATQQRRVEVVRKPAGQRGFAVIPAGGLWSGPMPG